MFGIFANCDVCGDVSNNLKAGDVSRGEYEFSL